MWSSAERFATAVTRVEEVGADRDVAWRHGMQIWIGIGDDAEAGRANVAHVMSRFYNMPFEPFARYVPVGTAEQIAAGLAPFVEAGATILNLTPCGPDPLTAFETVAEVKRILTA